MTRVLHVLPHAGAGAQTYIEALATLEGFACEVFELTGSRSPAAAAASMAVGRPALWRAARRNDLIHVHGEVASLATLGLLAAHRSVVTLHGLHLLRRLTPGWQTRAGRAGLRAVVAASDATICVSQSEREDLSWLPARSSAKLLVIRNGMALPAAPDEPARHRARDALGLTESAIVVLYLGQLEPRKDPVTAVRAVQHAHERDPRIVLLVAGSGPCAASLAALAGPETRLLGQRSDIPVLLAAADVFVMPSIREGLSYAVLEAMAYGLATVVSDGAGNPEAVGDAGLVHAAGDAEGLASLLLELAADPSRRAALGDAARHRVATQLTVDAMLSRTRAVYESVLKGPGRSGGAPPA